MKVGGLTYEFFWFLSLLIFSLAHSGFVLYSENTPPSKLKRVAILRNPVECERLLSRATPKKGALAGQRALAEAATTSAKKSYEQYLDSRWLYRSIGVLPNIERESVIHYWASWDRGGCVRHRTHSCRKLFFFFIVTRNPTGVVVRSLLSKEKLWFFTMWGGVVGDRSCGIRFITVSNYFFFIQT